MDGIITDIDAESAAAQTVAMGTVVGATIPDALWPRLGDPAGDGIAQLAVPLCTIDAGGWPHVALVSDGELYARDRTRIDLLLSSASGTASNLRQRPRCTLVFVDADLATYVKATAREHPAGAPPQLERTVFELRIDQVIVDAPDPRHEADVRIRSGIVFTAAPSYEAARRRMRGALAVLPPLEDR